MNRNEYTTFVKSIWMDGGHRKRNLAVAGLGLIGECGEVCEVLLDSDNLTNAGKLIDECGDVLYYACILADWKDLDVENIWPAATPDLMEKHIAGLMLCRDAKEVSERVKKFIRDGADPTAETLWPLLRRVLFDLERILKGVGADLYDAMDKNVAKLEVRYAEVL